MIICKYITNDNSFEYEKEIIWLKLLICFCFPQKPDFMLHLITQYIFCGVFIILQTKQNMAEEMQNSPYYGMLYCNMTQYIS